MVRAHNLHIGYKVSKKTNKVLASDINVCAAQGELVAVIGSNGSGKSTLLRTLSRLQQPLSGLVAIDSKATGQFSREAFAAMVSFVSTDVVKVQNLTIYQLVALGRFPHTNWLGKLTANDVEIIDRAIENVGLNHMKHQQIIDLSDGERQRCMIARALSQDTPVIILDEPTAFLDIRSKYEVVHLLSDLALHHKKTVIFSTHDFHIALTESDKIWLLRNNTIVEGAPEDVMLSTSFHDIFGDQLSFDWATGTFKRLRSVQAFIHVDIKDDKIKMLTIRALERVGYAFSTTAEATVGYTDTTDGRGWMITKNEKTVIVNSIYELCTKAKSFIT